MWFSRKKTPADAAEASAKNTSANEATSRRKGAAIEAAAEAYLRTQGLKPVARNYCIRGGEIDLIMRDGAVLVFIEVRYRANARHGSGAESITPRKQQKLLLTAEHYLQQQFGSNPPDCRFDVISASGDPVLFDWLKNVFA
ncbi:YraN family protein [Thalassolituus sp. LLYu03]|uniref:YraN family protein n=1 Tax=Thalassolituus sp. LLYu03 TaxID=3421656 RepID=UPI003D2C4841